MRRSISTSGSTTMSGGRGKEPRDKEGIDLASRNSVSKFLSEKEDNLAPREYSKGEHEEIP